MKITVKTSGSRLDKYIAGNSEFSRAYVLKLLDEGAIKVNGEIKNPSYKVKENEKIDIVDQIVTEQTIEPQQMDLDIVYEDEYLVVVNKPSSLIVHPGAGHPDNTLVNGLVYHINKLSMSDSLRPGIVHRIDKDTSGLLMVAKDDKTHEFLASQLKSKSTTRKYIALVHGQIIEDEAEIDAPIARDPKNRQMMCVSAKNSREAQTHFKVLERFANYTLIECELLTGRTHQIRVHLNYINHPVVGDPVYGPKRTIDTIGQALHAAQLGFIHPQTHRYIEFEAPLPEEFVKTLNYIKENDGYSKA